MNNATETPISRRPTAWAVGRALTLVYLSWGPTDRAIKEGVKAFPPALFGGPRIVLAGLLILGYLAARGERLRLTGRELLSAAAGGAFLFVGGNYLIAVGQKTVESSTAAVLVATTPLFLALLELAWPWGERLTRMGWLGLLAGLGGVLLLLDDAVLPLHATGIWLILASAFCWALGSFILRHEPRNGSPFRGAAYQMVLGGGAMILLGIATGEPEQLDGSLITPTAVYAFFHLLIAGSLIGFLAYAWLLRHVSAALAGTYAYVNPVVAIFVGWLVADEPITPRLVAGMLIILAGVALVRVKGSPAARPVAASVPSPSANGQASGGKAHHAPVPSDRE